MRGSNPVTEIPRTERKRLERERRIVDAAKRIVADEGFEALTMQRLADDLDLAVSATYRYFPSKGALVRQLQVEAIRNLAESLGRLLERLEADGSADRARLRLVAVGRWWCAASIAFPEDLRLLQMIMTLRNSTLDEDGGWKVLPLAMEVIGQVAEVIEQAQEAGVISPGNAIDRAIIWASGLSGVLQTDDLEPYVPEIFGGTRLAMIANADLLVGWGAARTDVERADAEITALAAETPLAT
jgi:AcrR family transcriptional regulator